MFEHYPSVVVLRALNVEAARWIEENCDLNTWQRIGPGDRWAIDTRYADDIAIGMQLSGLKIEKRRMPCPDTSTK